MSHYTRHAKYRELFRPGEGSIWWAFLPRIDGSKGRMVRVSTGHRDAEAAHRWYLERVRSSALVSPSPKKDRTLFDALTARLKWLRSAQEQEDATRKKLSPETIRFYERKSKPLLAVLGGETLLSTIGHEDIRRYIVERSASAKATTIAKELTTLATAMRLARKDGVDCADFDDIKPEDFAARYVPRDRWLTEPELEAIVFGGVLLPERAAIVAWIAATGSTYPSEVRAVRKRTHVRDYHVHIPGTKAGARDRWIVVPSHSRRFFDFAVKNLPVEGFAAWGNIRRDLHAAAALCSRCPECRRARLAWARHEPGQSRPEEPCVECKRTPNFAPFCPTDLRRTFAQWLVRSGVPYELAAPMMGHADTKMLEKVYGRRDVTNVATLVEGILVDAPTAARGAKTQAS